jgi:hypothetical protein
MQAEIPTSGSSADVTDTIGSAVKQRLRVP